MHNASAVRRRCCAYDNAHVCDVYKTECSFFPIVFVAWTFGRRAWSETWNLYCRIDIGRTFILSSARVGSSRLSKFHHVRHNNAIGVLIDVLLWFHHIRHAIQVFFPPLKQYDVDLKFVYACDWNWCTILARVSSNSLNVPLNSIKMKFRTWNSRK